MSAENSRCDSPVEADAVRKPAVKRGGVNIRGGRLMTNLGRGSVSNKKIVAPKIPQRRVKIKEEASDNNATSQAHVENTSKISGNIRGRGRGRQPKVYLQTGGSFLEQGPAMIIKKELHEDYHERVPRSSAREKFTPDVKIDVALINELLNFYDEEQAYCDSDNTLNPVKLPLLKKMLKCKKEEPIKVKQEIVDPDDIELNIKKECVETDEKNWSASLEGKFFTKIEHKTVDVKERSILDDINMSHGEDLLVLLQLPSCMPFKIPDDVTKDNRDTVATESKELQKDTTIGSQFKNVPEGRLGKLQFMKSGVVRLNFGNMCMAVEKAVHSETLYDVVSISTAGKEDSIVELGRIERKIILRPILKDVLEDSAKEMYQNTK